MTELERQKLEEERKKEQEAQGREMLEFEGVVPEEESKPDEGQPAEEPAEGEEPAEEEKPSDESSTEEESEKPEEPEESEEPKEPEEESETELLKKKIAALEEQNKALFDRLNAEGEPAPAVPAEEEAPPKGAAKQEEEVKVSEFVSEDEHTEMFSNRDVLNKVLSRVYHAGREAAMRELPELVRPEVRRQMRIERRVEAFFEDNKDLLRVRKYVGKVVGDLVVKGETDIDSALAKAGELVREELKIPKEEVVIEEKKSKTKRKSKQPSPNPAFAGPPGGGAPAAPAGRKTKLTADQAEVSEMIDFAKENA
mgnify:CR=1 FL=1